MLSNNDLWKYLITLIIGIFIGFCIYSAVLDSKTPTGEPAKIEYIEKHDTIKIDKETIKEKTDTIHKTDTLLKVDTIILKQDGTYVQLPKESYLYKDTIKKDSTEANIEITYSGISCSIDSVYLDFKTYNLKLTYYKEKPIKPFIFMQAGPTFNRNFRNLEGAAINVGAGIVGKSGWGGLVSYELDVGSLIQHEVKVGVIKLF